MIVPKFIADVVNGKAILRDPEAYRKYIENFKGSPVQIVISKVRRDRSGNQNRYYHGVVIKLLCDYSGDDPDSMHDTMRMMFLKVPTALGFETIRSTKDLSTVEFEEYLEKIRVWAAVNLSVYIPLPNECAEV